MYVCVCIHIMFNVYVYVYTQNHGSESGSWVIICIHSMCVYVHIQQWHGVGSTNELHAHSLLFLCSTHSTLNECVLCILYEYISYVYMYTYNNSTRCAPHICSTHTQCHSCAPRAIYYMNAYNTYYMNTYDMCICPHTAMALSEWVFTDVLHAHSVPLLCSAHKTLYECI